MAKVVVLASGEDADSVKSALEGASVDFEIVEPTAANLLHIVLGMVDDSGEEETPEEPPADEEPAPEEPVEEPPADEEPSEEEFKEALEVRVNGEMIKAVKRNIQESVLRVPSLVVGPKTTYVLNEYSYSFWPANVEVPTQRVLIENSNQKSSMEIRVQKTSGTTPYIIIGTDLKSLF